MIIPSPSLGSHLREETRTKQVRNFALNIIVTENVGLRALARAAQFTGESEGV